jgi:hypothetical protein
VLEVLHESAKKLSRVYLDRLRYLEATSFFLFLVLIFSFADSVSAATSNSSGLTYLGRIIKPDGKPMESRNVQFRLQIRSPNASSCVMYEEVQVIDMQGSAGVFSISINDGNGVRLDSNLWGLDRVFANRGSFNFDSSSCISGNTYTTDPGDGRKLQVYFKDETMNSWEGLPAQPINFVPMAIEANQVGGFTASSLLRVEDSSGVPSPVPSLSVASYSELVALVLGTSTQYAKRNQLRGVDVPALSAGQSLRWSGSAWEAYNASSLVESDPTVMAFAKTALPTCAAGSILTTDGSTLSCVPAPATGVTSVTAGAGLETSPSAGITSTGSISIADGGVTGAKIASGTITSDKLANSTVAPNTYTKVTVSEKGLVTGGASLADGDIPNLSWNKITSDKPTTLSGYDIIDGVVNSGGAPSVQAGVFADRPVTAATGHIYISTNTSEIFRYSGSSWSLISTRDAGQLVGTLDSNQLPVVPVEKGGTGLSASGTANQLLGVNGAGSALEYKSVTAGSGVTITPSAGGIQISAVGSGGTVTSVSGTSPIQVASGTSTPVISLASGSASGQTLVWNGSTWSAAKYSSLDLVNASGTQALPAGDCGVNQYLVWNSVSGQLSCQTIQDASASAKGLVQIDTARGLQVTSGVVGLANSGATAGEYTKVTVDAMGRVTAGASLASSDVTTALGFTPVNRTGDTMTGALNLPSNGLTVGTSQLVVSGGNIGVGTATPARSLDVNGSARFANRLEASASGSDGRIEAINGGWLRLSSSGNRVISDSLHLFDQGIATALQDLRISTNLDGASPGEKMRITGTGNVGIGTTAPATRLDVAGGVRVGAEANACGSGLTGTIRLNSTTLEYCNGTAWTALAASGAGITSLNGQTGNTQTFATPGTSGAAPNWISATGAHTLNIPMASGAGVTAGLISKTDYDAFNGKLAAVTGSSLNSGQIWVGNASNQASAVALSGDATLSNTGALTLSVSGVAAGTYPKLTVDAKGRVTAGSSLVESDIPNLSWDKITADKPTTLSGYGITDAIQNAGGTPSVQTGLFSARPAFGTAGRLFLASDERKLYRDTGTAWQLIASTDAADLTGALATAQLPIVPTSKGGTGLSASGTANQVLGMNSGATGLEYKSVTAGTGVSITHSAGGIQIAATGNGGTVTNVTGSAPISVATGTTTPVVSITSGTVNGQALVWNGTSWGSAMVKIADIRNTSGVSPLPAESCGTNQFLVWTSATDSFSCVTIQNASDIAKGIVQIDTTRGLQVSGGVVGLANSGASAGEYTKVTVDAMGRVTAGTSLAASDVTTALGYTPVNKAGDSMTGALSLPNNGLTVGASQLVVSGGNVGVGTTAPSFPLTVQANAGGNLQNWQDNAGDSRLSISYNANGTTINGGSNGVGTSALTLRSNNNSPTTIAAHNGAINIDPGPYDGWNRYQFQQNGQIDVNVINKTTTGTIRASQIIGGMYDVANDLGQVQLNPATSGTPQLGVVVRALGGGGANVGIGTTTPASRLDVAGGVKLGDDVATCAAAKAGTIRYNTGAMQFCNGTAWTALGGGSVTFPLLATTGGTAAAPAYSFDGDTNNGLFSPGADILALATSGAERLRVDSAGSVGIGTTAPVAGARVDITGTGAAASSIIIPRDTTANRPVSGVNGMMRYNTETNKFEFHQNGTWMNYASSDSSLSFPLLANPTGSALAPAFSFNGSPGTGIFSPIANVLGFAAGGSEHMRIDSSGRVGVGVLAPHASAKLEIESTAGGFLPPRMTTVQREAIASPANGLVVYDSNAQDLYVYRNGAWSRVSEGATVAFRVHRNGVDQSVSTGTTTLVDMSTKTFDTAGAFDLAADRFQPTVPGYYFLNGTAAITDLASTQWLQALIRKNGVSVAAPYVHSGSASDDPVVSASAVVYLNGTTDYVDFAVHHSHGSARSIRGAAGFTQFQGYLTAGGSGSGGAGGSGAGDNLGDHLATQNLILGGNWLSGDGDNEGIRISESGYVGIGTSTPDYHLTIRASNDSGIAIKDSGGTQRIGLVNYETINGGIATQTGGILNLYNRSDSIMAKIRGYTDPDGVQGWFSAGHMGFGTSTPDVPVHIKRDQNASSELKIENTNTGTEARSTIRLVNNVSNSGLTYISSTSTTNPARTLRIFNNDTAGGLRFFAGGSDRVTIAANGRVGIGTTSPEVSLDLSAQTDAVRLPTGTTAQRPAAAVNGMIRYNATSAKLEAFENGAWVDMIGGGGGGSVTFPLLSTTGGTAAAPAYSFSGDANTGVYSPGADQVALATNGAARVTVDATGNVGVGTTTPASKLDVSGDVVGTTVAGRFHDNGTSGAINFANGNVQTTSFDCGSAVSLSNMKDGGSYTLIITGTGTAQCTFSHSGVTGWRFSPSNAARIGSTHTIYTFLKAGPTVYISWIAGFVP